MSEQLLDFDKLTKIKWHYFHRRFRTPFYQFLMLEGVVKHYNQDVKFPYELKDFIYLDQHLAVAECFAELGEEVKKQLSQDNRYLLKHFDYFYEMDDQIKTLSKKLAKIDFQNSSKEQITKYFKEYIDLSLKFGACVLIVLSVEKHLEESLQKAIGNNAEAYQALTTPIKPSAVQKEEMSLLKMAEKFKANIDISVDLDTHLEEFAWLKNNSLDGQFYSKEEILQRVKAIQNPKQRLADYITKIERQKNEYDQWRQKFTDTKIGNLVDTIQESIFFRSWRTERYYRNAYYLQGLFSSLSKIFGLANEKDIYYLTHEEILDSLEKNKTIDFEKIAERKIGYVIYVDNHNTTIYSGKFVDQFKQAVKLFDEKPRQLVGMTAFGGLVIGRACIVNYKNDLEKIKLNDILIAHTTVPDYVPFLKNVKAIVTEEGGILSHASVISRELHIPCIIGIKGITKVIKDGDKVEVDADKGLVKIL